MHFKNQKITVVIIAVIATLVSGYAIVKTSTAFTGPTTGPGIGGGALQFNQTGNFSIGNNPPSADTKLLISGPTSGGYQLRIDGDSSIPIFRVESGKVLIGNITDSGSAGLQAGSISATTSSFDFLEVKRASVYGILKASGTAVDISGFSSISAGSILGTFTADVVTAGAFNPGNYSFPASLGVGTSSNQTLPATLSVYGTGYFSGNVGIGEQIPSTGPGAINVLPSITNNIWLGSGPDWLKAIRIESNGAIEFGGGTSLLFGLGSSNNKFYIFNTDTEYNTGQTPIYNLVMSTTGVSLGSVTAATTPGAVLELIPPASFSYPALSLGRGTGQSSIRAIGTSGVNADLVIDSTSTGNLYLNNYHSGNVIIATSTGKVGIKTSSPQAELDVNGTVKMTGFRLGSSAAAGYILTASSSGDGTGTWQPSPFVGGSGTANYIAKWNSANSLGDSSIYETGGKIGIGTTNPQGKLDVSGSVAIGSYAGVSSPPSNGLIVSGNFGIGTDSPGAQLEVVTSSQKAIRLKKTSGVAGSVDLYVGVSTISQNPSSTCSSIAGANKSQCLAGWSSTGTVIGCLGQAAIGNRSLCSAVGD